MGTVAGVTSQLNAIGGCTPARDCCGDVDALKGEVARLSQRLSSIEGESRNALQKAGEALGNALDAKAQASTLTGEIGSLNDDLAAIGVAVAAAGALAARAWGAVSGLSASIAPLLAALPGILAAVAGIGAIGLSIAAAQTLAQSAYDLAQTALQIASSAGDQAATAILRNRDTDAKAVVALGAASSASSEASRAIAAASSAQTSADRALSAASAASSASDRANSAAVGAKATADRALSATSTLSGQLSDTRSIAVGAKATADRALSATSTLSGQLSDTRSIAVGAKATADRALSATSTLSGQLSDTRSTAVGAKATADRAIAIAQGAASKQSIPGKTGAAGRDGQPGIAGRPGIQGIPGIQGRAGTAGRDGANGRDGQTIIQPTTVNPGKEDEIIRLLQGTKLDVLAIPAALVASQSFRSAAISAAAVGSCQSSQPGGCPGGNADRFSKLDGTMGAISSAFGALNNAVLGTITSTLNVINTKLGTQIAGGLSAWTGAIAEVVNRSQILNILTYISVLHNAYFLSNSLTQTLFSAVSNSLAALGIKDTTTDPAGQPFNVGKIVGDWTEGFFKATFGVATVEGIKADWKKYSRIYQAAANVMYSIQSISHSILGALEVVGSHVSKIGNALQKFRAVGERAYGWMNPQPSFQNRFFTGLQATQEVVSQVDQVASEVLSVQETITQMGKNKDDLVKSIGEDPDGKKADAQPEAAQVKAAADAAKLASKTPDIPESSQIKP